LKYLHYFLVGFLSFGFCGSTLWAEQHDQKVDPAVVGCNPKITKCFSWFFDGEASSIAVDKTCQLCIEEKSYIARREQKVKDGLLAFTGQASRSQEVGADVLPRLSFAFSGGGYRTMISSLGFMLGAQEIGLLDATSYVAGLSGSTWMMGNALLRMKRSNMGLLEFRELLQKRVERPFGDLCDFEFDDFFKHMFTIFTERGVIEPADCWGALFADRLWGDLEGVQKNYIF